MPEPGLMADLLERIDDARVSHRPVAFVQHRDGAGLNMLGFRIGRYEPIFNSDYDLPDGLIDFIISNADPEVALAGVADLDHFQTIQSLLTRAGVTTELDRSAILPE